MPKHPGSAPESAAIFHHCVEVEKLKQNAANKFEIVPGGKELILIQTQSGASAVRKLRFQGSLRAVGKSDWHLKARLGTTVEQPCVVTLKPVTTRIEADVERVFVRQMPTTGENAETEFDGDDKYELLEDEIDLGQVLVEELVLALPEYPRLSEVELEKTTFAEEGITPMSDDDSKPFASLAEFRSKMKE